MYIPPHIVVLGMSIQAYHSSHVAYLMMSFPKIGPIILKLFFLLPQNYSSIIYKGISKILRYSSYTFV